jgi:hypothetical protein
MAKNPKEAGRKKTYKIFILGIERNVTMKTEYLEERILFIAKARAIKVKHFAGFIR